LTEEMKAVADAEGKTPDFILRGVARGRIVIPLSPYRYTRPVGIGKGLRTKVNASIDPETARLVQADRAPSDAEVCTMCGDYCALKIVKESIDLAR
jgi:phosphomethylpyrimidine synthase